MTIASDKATVSHTVESFLVSKSCSEIFIAVLVSISRFFFFIKRPTLLQCVSHLLCYFYISA